MMSRLFVSRCLTATPPPPQDVNRKSTTVVESWEGSKSRQSFSHSVSRNVSITYTWAFQRTNRASDVSGTDADNQ